tara:strand:- start:13340 stop:14038 length:699 start_codon:yes stop_codon:yes gene_type:complete
MAVILEVNKPGNTDDLLEIYLRSTDVLKGFQFNISGVDFDNRHPIETSHRNLHVKTGIAGLVLGYPVNPIDTESGSIISPQAFTHKIKLGSFRLRNISATKFPFCIHSSIFVNDIGEVIENVINRCHKSVISEPDPIDIPGDVNLDGSIDVIDIVNIVNHILGVQPLDGQSFENADINDDGSVDVVDIVSIVNIILDRFGRNMTSDEVNKLVNRIISRAVRENLIKSGRNKK